MMHRSCSSTHIHSYYFWHGVKDKSILRSQQYPCCADLVNDKPALITERSGVGNEKPTIHLNKLRNPLDQLLTSLVTSMPRL